MNATPTPIAASRWFLPVLMSALAVFLPAHAQLPSIKSAVETPKPKEQASPEKPEDVRKRLELWHQKAREDLDRFDHSAAKAALPEGITAADLDDRLRDLEQMTVITTGSIKNLNMAAESRKAAEAARAADAEWTGFKEPPPFSILMLDELLNERDAVKSRLNSHEASLVNFERLLGNVVAETKAAEDAVSKQVAVVQSADEQAAAAAKWSLDSARIKSRLMAARVSYLQAGCGNFKERITAAKADLALAERKVLTAKPHERFGADELARIGKLAKERKNAVEKELAAVTKRLKSALALRTQAQDALDALPAADGKEPGGLELAKFRLEVAEARIESLQSVSEQLESLIQLENIGVNAYNERHTLMTSSGFDERAKALETIGILEERLRAWLTVVDNELAACWADLSAIESRAASIAVGDPRFPLVNEQRAAHSEKLAMIQRVRQAASTQRKLIQRWIDDHTPKKGEEGLFDKASLFGEKAGAAARKIWSSEVMSFDDSYTTADGVVMPGKISVTLGMLLRAVLFFAIGYFISSRVVNHIQGKLVSRGLIAEPQAKTLRNWAMIAVGVALVLGTLSFLKIPLTVFAFFGGALAIGVGFGTQTLIKNFISGIIVLAERKVRVGDILDVDGVVGTVIEVNTRSSIIRGADDVETMIPNSLFLENRVTNWTLSSTKMRRNLRVNVAYGSDTRVVMDILTDAAGRHGKICKDPAPFAVFEDFGESSLVFGLYFWLELNGGTNPMIVTSDLRLMMEKRFTEAGVGVPFPQRDMHLTTETPIQVQVTHER